MAKWEYKRVSIEPGNEDYTILNGYGAEEWELVGAAISPNGKFTHYYFKRPKKAVTDKHSAAFTEWCDKQDDSFMVRIVEFDRLREAFEAGRAVTDD